VRKSILGLMRWGGDGGLGSGGLYGMAGRSEGEIKYA